MCTRRSHDLRITIGNGVRARRPMADYFSCVEVLDRAGNRGAGVTDLKAMFGHPDELRLLVMALADLVPEADAVAAADPGSAPLTAVLAFQLRVPVLFVRSTRKTHFLSYGGDPAHNHQRISGERLAEGRSVVIIDDLLHSGETAISAANTLREVGLVVSAASCLLAAPPDAWRDRMERSGFESVSAVALTTDL